MALLVVSGGIVCSLIQCKAASILPGLSTEFGMNTSEGSLMLSIFTFMGIIFSIPAGQTIQHLGAKRVMVGSVAVMVAGSLLGSFAPDAVILIVSRGIEGVALVFITIAGAAFIRDSAPPERMGAAIGIWSIWFASGSFLAGVISPTLYHVLGFQALWLIYAALAVVSALAIRFLVKAPNIVHAQVVSEAGKPRYRELLTRNVVLFMLVFAVYNIMTIAIVSYLPAVLQSKGYDETSSGLISTIPVLMSIVSAPLLGVLSDRLGRVKPLMSFSMAVLACTVPVLFLVSGWELWAVALVCGAFGAGGAGVVMLGLLAVLPRTELVALALGVFSTMLALGMTLGNFLVPLLLGPDLTNLTLTAIVLFCIGVVGLVLSLLCRYR
ncbi:MAG: MFS transporter [Coriobacteriales bacterium]|jgi:MFS family permease|nr:MFS transporter [Coriobacteriales bacterium]